MTTSSLDLFPGSLRTRRRQSPPEAKMLGSLLSPVSKQSPHRFTTVTMIVPRVSVVMPVWNAAPYLR
ncbi:MAG: hypothetical protein KGR25_09460, partial [Chloroflexi bacterium]|nr:hypothetical protein [Chloroflexota bacterium]